MEEKLNEYLSSQEAADFIGVHLNTIKNWAKTRKIRIYKNPINGWYMYKRSDLEELLAKINDKQPR